MHDNQSFDDREWTDDERAQLAALSAGRLPRAELQERTTRALRDAGLLRPARRTTLRAALRLAAAAAIVFGAGAAVGYAAGERRASARRDISSDSSPSPSPSSLAATRAAKQVVWF
jgi:hypothetical protein